MAWQDVVRATFQLPHSDYSEEAHTGHVYAIQLSGKWLVSGSADKTVRVWDFETRRLRGRPLIGHSQSVLCLRFDHNEDEDVIVSGSADASVILWRFSTGQLLKTISSAHEESILDLKFNRSHLFTCSKDRTIKIWSRCELTPVDQGYPHFQSGPDTSVPEYIVDVSSMGPSLIEAGLANGSSRNIEPYAHLATFRGHSAAVNAIDIHEDLLISASGDRTMRVWNTTTGQCIRSLVGYGKGVACVQTDGKQIVSGSSDNSVRIHDLATGAEVAVLLGHSNLVRTVQADFGDILEGVVNAMSEGNQGYNDAQSLKNGITMEEQSEGQIARGTSSGTEAEPEPITKTKKDDSNWNRIISGSYDESIIIWRKDAEGRWNIEHTLRLRDMDALYANNNHPIQATSSGDHQHINQISQEPQLRVFKVRFDRERIVCSSQDSRIYCWELATDEAECCETNPKNH